MFYGGCCYSVDGLYQGSVHSSDGVSDSLPPSAVVQTAVPAQMLHQIQPTLQVQQLYPGQDQYVERRGGVSHYSPAPFTHPVCYPYSDSALYSQTPPSTSSSYYEAPPPACSELGSRPLSVTTAMGGGGGGGGVTCRATGGNNTRAAPATVRWLYESYEAAEGASVPRSELYGHYRLHCQQRGGARPVNPASFGKLIRAVFTGLRTRRLGTRGNSKYHYYGLRVQAGSSLSTLIQDQQHLDLRQQPLAHTHGTKPVQKLEGVTNETSAGAGQWQEAGLFDISAQLQQYQQFLDPSPVLPAFPRLDLQGSVLPSRVLPEHIQAFQLMYREHCEAILDVMVNLQFTLLETLWKTFWSQNERLPRPCLVLLCRYGPVLSWVRRCDTRLYQTLVDTLLPHVLSPVPSALTQAIRSCAKSLESWLTSAMINIPEEMVRIKVLCVRALSRTLRRYTSLNHLAQAARAVLQSPAHIAQMLDDLHRVDFNSVQAQASWACGCERGAAERLRRRLERTLRRESSPEQWAAWLESVVSRVLEPAGRDAAGVTEAAKKFLLNWCFYSSVVIRDLTLRSAASFGSFHLVRLLCDEYVYHVVQRRVAATRGLPPLALAGESVSGRSLNSLDQEEDEEEEDEDEESEGECREPTPPSNGGPLGEGPKEPPAKMARTDPGTPLANARPTD